MSEEKPRTSHLVEDLSVLSRRGALSGAEQQAFADALESSATLSTAHQLGCDFDQIANVKPGDDALIADVAARVLARRAAGARAGQFRFRALLLVAALISAGSAAAWWQRGRATSAHSVPPPAGSRLTSPARTPATAPAPATSTPPAPEQVPPPAGGAPSSRASSGRTVSEPAATRPTETGPNVFASAEALFREASAARRAGDRAGARALYLRLEREFPASDEAHLAHVSLGNLLLDMGRAREAEQQFASYLGGRPALAQEALIGRAQSLAALGQTDEERRVWTELLHDYPGSVYAARAKQRLAQLAPPAASSK
jgi:TolA-binding protein